MIRNCPKCGYARKATDAKVPDWQCPSCGIAYQKFIDQQNPEPSLGRSAPLSGPAPQPLTSMSATALFFILAGLLAVGYVGYRQFNAHKMQERVAAAGEWSGKNKESGEILEVSNPAYYGTMEEGRPVLRMKPATLVRLNRLAPGPVIMFATAWCPYCAKAREVFAKQGVHYTELDLERDSAAADFQKDVMGLSGFPTIVIGNRVTQGFDEGQIVASLNEL
jgi:glutaredoxin